MQRPELVAHRGHARQFPENTLPAIDSAIACGARYVEVDVQLTADAVPVLFHDRTLERVCGQPGAIHDYPASAIARFRAAEQGRFGDRHAEVRIATLAELAALASRHPGVTLFVEAKRVALARFGNDRFLDAITEALRPVLDRCVIISFAADFLRRVRDRTRLPVGLVTDAWLAADAPDLAALAPEYLFCDLDGLPATGTPALPAPTQLVVYEVDDVATVLALARRGVPFIETFAIAELRTALAGLTT